MNDFQSLNLSVKLINISDVAYLSTINSDNFPEIRAMLNLRNAEQYPGLVDLFKEYESNLISYFTTNTSSLKIESILANPNVCVYYCKTCQSNCSGNEARLGKEITRICINER